MRAAVQLVADGGAARRFGARPPASRGRPRSGVVSGRVSAQTSADAAAPPRAPIEDAKAFLAGELRGLFTPQGDVTRARYAPGLLFEDPITRLEGLEAYTLLVRAIKTVFRVDFELHTLQITAPDEITARWTMALEARLLPWQPKAVFTGRSKYKVDPRSGLITRHVDTWDAVQDNAFPSIEGLALVLRQALDFTLTPDLETPRYSVLKAARDYELRRYDQFVVAEVPMGDNATPAGGSGFGELAGYIFGANADRSKMEMTTPVLTEPSAAGAGARMQFPMGGQFGSPDALPAPLDGRVERKAVGARYVAAKRFSGWPLDYEVRVAERDLRSAVLRDGLQPAAGYRLARYNDPTTPPFLRRNEVLIDLPGFEWP